MDAWTLRPLDGSEEDLRFLAAMLYEAATWRHGERRAPAEVLADPAIARYAADWGREGDFGVVAVPGENERLGVAWYRFFSAAEPGYGFVAEHIPELSVAVRKGWRGRGVGTSLLEEIIRHAFAEKLSLSLSVERDNPALRLYRRLGVEVLSEEDGALVLLLEP